MTLLAAALSCTSVTPYQVLTAPGRYRISESRYCLELFVDEGAVLSAKLLPGGKVPTHARDITAIAWLDDHTLLYSQSAVYGVGGLFQYDAHRKRETWLVPSHPPQEADDLNGYFKLIRVSSSAVEYWFTPDINRIDESNLEATAERRTFRREN